MSGKIGEWGEKEKGWRVGEGRRTGGVRGGGCPNLSLTTCPNCFPGHTHPGASNPQRLVKQNSQDTSRTGSGTPRRSLVAAPAVGSKAEQGPPSQATDPGLSVTNCLFPGNSGPFPGAAHANLSPPPCHPNNSCFLGSIPDASPRKTGAGNHCHRTKAHLTGAGLGGVGT